MRTGIAFFFFYKVSFLKHPSVQDHAPLFNGQKQREIELVEGSACVSWYETELLIGQPNGGSPKLSKYPRG